MTTTTSSMREYQLVIIGGGEVGKQELAIQFIHGFFAEQYDPTIADTPRKQCIIDGEAVVLNVLDTSGQEEYTTLREQFMRAGDGFLILYSITSRPSFAQIDMWYQLARRAKGLRGYETFPVVIVGNHCDRASERQVSLVEGQDAARRLNCGFVEASAKERINVDEAFYTLVREIKRHNSQAQAQVVPPPTGALQDKQEEDGRRSLKCCCSNGCVLA
ncbi:ras-like protein [Auriculariales sp. MPI-PUGE-AT-0066]|nr:ras-like protein [Auriculariales sp. MPI-PUGE-AT-0066]